MERELIKEIENLIEGDVETSEQELESHSTDYSIFKIRPQVIVYPKHSEDIQKLVKWLTNKKESGGYSDLSITARAAGTCMSGGSLNDSIILDVTRYMSGVLEVKKENLGTQVGPTGHKYPISGFAKVLPGTPYRDFEKETKKQDLILPCFPASKNLCAVGGMVANNGAGEKTLKYGQNKDFVQELKVVFADGNEYTVKPITKTELEAKVIEDTFEGRLYRSIWNIYKRNDEDIANAKPGTTKNSSGYLIWDVWDEKTQMFDLTKLVVGAQGTTGIITEITYKLVPVETHSNLLVMFAKNINVIPEMVQDLQELDVETIEVYDDHTFKFAVKFFRDFLKDKGVVGALKYFFNFIPELFMFLTGGIPKFVILVEFVSNNEDEIEAELHRASQMMRKYPVKMRVLEHEDQIQKYWDVRRDSFKLLTDHSKKLRTAPFIDDIVVPVESLPEYIPQLTNMLDDYNLLYTIAGHVGNGNLHIIPLMDFSDPQTVETIITLSPKIYEMVKHYGGSMTAEHNDGLIRTPFLGMMFGEKMVEVFKEVKESFDSRYMFNPKKKVGATQEDIQEYIIRPGQKYS